MYISNHRQNGKYFASRPEPERPEPPHSVAHPYRVTDKLTFSYSGSSKTMFSIYDTHDVYGARKNRADRSAPSHTPPPPEHIIFQSLIKWMNETWWQGRDVVVGAHFQTVSATTTLTNFNSLAFAVDGNLDRRERKGKRIGVTAEMIIFDVIIEYVGETSSQPNRTCNNSIRAKAWWAEGDGPSRGAL